MTNAPLTQHDPDRWLDAAAARLMSAEEKLLGGRAAHDAADELAQALVDLGRAIAALPVRDREFADVEYEAEALVDYRTPGSRSKFARAPLSRDAELMAQVCIHLVRGAVELLVRSDREQAAECVGAAVESLHSVLLERRRG